MDPVVAFNDDPNTRHADVLNALDAAIKEASRDCPPGRFNLIWPKKNGYEATEVFSYLNPREGLSRRGQDVNLQLIQDRLHDTAQMWYNLHENVVSL